MPRCPCRRLHYNKRKPARTHRESQKGHAMQISKRTREIALLALIAAAAGLANLPEDLLEGAGIERDFLLGSLALTVFIALFLYLKFQFFFLVVLLAIAANMPGEVAESLGISTLPLII